MPLGKTTSPWTPTAFTPATRDVAAAVAVVRVPAAGSHGSGWLVSRQHVVTNYHVVADAGNAPVFIEFADGTQALTLKTDIEPETDLAVLHIQSRDDRAPLKIDTRDIDVGAPMTAWGHPAPYNGPAPLLIVGHLAGFSEHPVTTSSRPQHRLVLNAAFNPGNSGGPVTLKDEKGVRGVVVSKAVNVPSHLMAAIAAMDGQTGITLSYPVHMPDGTVQRMVEAQIVAESLHHFFRASQLVLGEAIMARDLVAFLRRFQVPWSSV